MHIHAEDPGVDDIHDNRRDDEVETRQRISRMIAVGDKGHTVSARF